MDDIAQQNAATASASAAVDQFTTNVAAVPAAAQPSSTPSSASSTHTSSSSSQNVSQALNEDERAARKAAREARQARVREIAESVTPLYPGRPECRICIYNVAKKQNVGTIVRTAVAFGATQVVVVGNRKLNTLGNQQTNRFISWRHFVHWSDMLAWARKDGWKVIGIEIGSRAVPVMDRPFTEKTLFILGNEGVGMSEECMKDCDALVYIPQYGVGTASLNVATAAAIVLHHFAEWAQYPSHTAIAGAKFVVDESKALPDPGLIMKQQLDQDNPGHKSLALTKPTRKVE